MKPIRRNKSHEHIVKALTEKIPGLEKGVFSTIRDVMVLAAALGFEHRKRASLDADPISLDSDPFSNHTRTRGFMYTLALAETQDQDLLKDQDKAGVVEEIFEQYACGGFNILREWLKEMPPDANPALTIIDGLRRTGAMRPKIAIPPSEDVDF